MKRFVALVCACLACVLLVTPAFAHSGRTDSSGGHRDNKNVSGLGSYHYHHGYGPHLHPNGICPYAPKDTISISNQPSTMIVGEKVALEWTVTYYSGSSSVSWSSSDEDVLSASGGLLNAKSPGTTTVTATLHNGAKTFKVTVKEIPVTSVSIAGAPERLELNQSAPLSASIEPSNATYQDVTWSSSNPEVAAVDASGRVSAVSPGTAAIMLESKNGKKDTVSIEVFSVPPETVSFVGLGDAEMEIGSSGTLQAKVLPDNTTDKTVNWSSSAPDIIAVSATGDYECLKEGSAVITAVCQDVSVEQAIEVHRIPVEEITFDLEAMGLKADLKIRPEDTFTLIAVVAPQNATFPDVTYTSSDPSVIKIENGQVIAVGEGTADLIASTADTSSSITIKVVGTSTAGALLGVGVVACIAAGAAAYKIKKKKN